MKKEFFYNQRRFVDWLNDYRDIFGLEQKSIQPYVSLWLNDEPQLPSGAKHVDSVPGRGVRAPTFGKARVLIRTPRRAA